jgi:hypothetical protein
MTDTAHLSLADAMRAREDFQMNRPEAKVAATYQRKGWQVYRNGWPDLLCYWAKGRKNRPPTLKFVEVKGPGDSLHGNQHEVLALLARAGFVVSVVYLRRTSPLTGQPDDFEHSYNTNIVTSLTSGLPVELDKINKEVARRGK